jgi:integrase
MRSFNLLREYIGTRVDGALFEGRSGGHLVREAPTVYLRRILSTLNMNYTMHQLRHTAATNWINRGGMSTLVVQDLLGHSSSIYTERYVQVREWKKRADLKAYAMANG